MTNLGRPSDRGHGHAARDMAISELFTALDGMIRSYELLPEHEQVRRRADDAERITGEIALRLGVARARLAATVASAPV